MYQAGTNGTPNANLTQSLLCVVFGYRNVDFFSFFFLFVVLSCIFDRSIEYFVMSLMHPLHKRYDHLIRFSFDNWDVMSVSACPVTLTNLKHCFMAFVMPSEKQ